MSQVSRASGIVEQVPTGAPVRATASAKAVSSASGLANSSIQTSAAPALRANWQERLTDPPAEPWATPGPARSPALNSRWKFRS